VERDHELTTEVVLAESVENGETAEFVMRDAVRRSSAGANRPNRLKRGQEAEQEVLSCLV
jgi:hypothetical protein